MRTSLFLASFAIGLIFSSLGAHAKGCLRVGYIELGKDIEQALIEIANETYKEAGLCATYEKLPLPRLHLYLTSGKLDAHLAEESAFVKSNPETVVALPTIIGQADIGIIYDSTVFRSEVALSSFAGQRISLLSNFALDEYIVDQVKGIKDYAPSYSIMMNRLSHGRTHAIAIAKVVFDTLKKEMNLSDQYKFLKVTTVTGYHALNIKHADKVGRLNKALKKTLEKATFDERLNAINRVSR